jgi:hypothetical protein
MEQEETRAYWLLKFSDNLRRRPFRMKRSLVRGWLLFFVFLFCLPVTLHAAIDGVFPVPSLVAEEPIAHVINFGIDFKESTPS